ncbi:M24 family metallopeptidase [Oleidesulfovibrio sp.]|uniref:M24 family metallopeptidase n=1 Tax=Oleidesulfovibrio sp. TaxID=2909707 RepID=UPI003A86D7EE
MTEQSVQTIVAAERMPEQELALRYARLRTIMQQQAPQVSGMLIFSRLNIYYLTGTLGNGVLWLPVEGEPVLLLRRGLERAAAESPLKHILSFRSFSDVIPSCCDAGSPLGRVVGVEQSGLTWQLGSMLQTRLKDVEFVAADGCLAACRSVKTEWELRKMRLSGARHHEGLYHRLPKLLHHGMTERAIAHAGWQTFFSLGHSGIMRMNAAGEEIFLGHVCAGESGNYPGHFNGPLGLVGEHPATPVMGYAGRVWKKGQVLSCDIAFCLEGYHTDKTQIYYSGSSSSIPDVVRRAHDACIEIQQRTAEALKPGAIPSKLYAHSLELAEKAGFGEGFMGLGNRKVVFLGHGIGLAIDDQPVLAKRFDAPVEAGMVFAVEPKISIAGVGMVGVENTFEVTAKGSRCLTGDAYDIVCVE